MNLPGKSITRMEAYPRMDFVSSLKKQRRPLRLTAKFHSTRSWISRFSKRHKGSLGWGDDNEFAECPGESGQGDQVISIAYSKDNCPPRVISSSATGWMHSGPSYFAELTIGETS